jgi:hypothetical protein
MIDPRMALHMLLKDELRSGGKKGTPWKSSKPKEML